MSESTREALSHNPDALAAYDTLMAMSPEDKRDRDAVTALTRVIDEAHVRNGIARVPGYQIVLDGTAIQAPDGSTYGPTAIKRITGSRRIPQ
jgi:hypothetical protein